MLTALLVFLVGALVLAVIMYVVHMLIGMMHLPPEIVKIALLIFALVCLIILIIMVVAVYRGGWSVGDILR